MARGLEDLRNLSKEIERKRHEAEKKAQLQKIAVQETLSTQAKLKGIKRSEEAGQAASKSSRFRNVLLYSGIAVIAVLWITILYSARVSRPAGSSPHLSEEDISAINPSDASYPAVHKFISAMLASKDDVDFDPAVPEIWRVQSEKTLSTIRTGEWNISGVYHSGSFGYFEVTVHTPRAKRHLIVRISEPSPGKFAVIRIY